MPSVVPHRQSTDPTPLESALRERVRVGTGVALLLLGGAFCADHPPALARDAEGQGSSLNTSLGPPITLAEVASHGEWAVAQPPVATEPDAPGGTSIVQLPPKPNASPDSPSAPPLVGAAAGGAPPSPASAPPDPAPARDAAATPARAPMASPAPAEGIPLELELLSNRQEYDAQLERFVTTGNVTARIAGGRLQAERIEFDPASRTLFAIGAVRFQRGQQFFQASRLRYSLLEGNGELDDVYGVLDLDGSAQDLDLTQPPSTPLPQPEPFSCPPSLPPIPEWHPYPWAVTGWAGQMTTANFGDAFLFNGRPRPEYLMGVGVQRRLINGGPLALELDANLLGHHAARQSGGPYNQAKPYADTPSQTFGEATLGIGARLWLRPWLNIFFEEGVSFLTDSSNWERTERENYANFLNYLAFEVEALVTPEWSVVGRIHHRSGAFGVYSGVREGSNGYLLGVRHRFGTAERPRRSSPMPAPQGCPGAPPPDSKPREDLASQLEAVTMGGEPQPGVPPPPSAAVTGASPPAQGTVWSRASQAERLRDDAIAQVDQRVKNVRFQQSLTAERRYGFPSQFGVTASENEYGDVRPGQLNPLTSKDNRPLIKGTISRWRVQASRLVITPTTFSGDRVAFSNDPFTPAQSWLDSESVVGTLKPNGDTEIKAGRNAVVLEDRLRIPARRQTLIRKQEEVDNPWVIGIDREDRDGVFLGYTARVRLGERGQLTLQPQVLVERAIDGESDSYPYPWQSAGAGAKKQPATTGDDFGFLARLQTTFLGFETNARVDFSTFNPDNIPNGTRSWGELTRDLRLPWVGDSELRLFSAYRFRTWNGTLGEQDVYSAFGGFLEKKTILQSWGRLSSNYLWRVGVGNYQSDQFDTSNLATLWRGNAIGSVNLSLSLWRGKPAPGTPLQGMANTAQAVVPGLTLNANLQGTLAYYGDGTNQNTASLSGGPTLTLGHFVKPFLDYTQLTVTGGGTLRQGVSPFGFDRAVDLGTLGIGLTQQIVGPVVFNGGVGLNVDPGSSNYGEVTGSYLEVRWQRRSYEVGIFYSPYDGLGGVRVKLNDFNFTGPGVPFVPITPIQQRIQAPF
ncbi:MAG: DUF3769 domain-containing protein [Cyanobacteriota bacterium]